jgi:tRNA threonylcarbamoyladenosine biosynthesis protein TsaB
MGYVDKSLVLAVETSGRKGSAAVGIGDQVLAKRTLSGRLRHGSELLTCCNDLIESIGGRPSDITNICISAGPGSFTGIRIAVTIGKIMNFACDAKIIPLSTMDVLAENVAEYPPPAEGSSPDRKKPTIQNIATILDAKRGQFYVALFERTHGRWRKSVNDCLMTSSQFVQRFAAGDKTISLLGEGLVYYADQFAGERIELLDESCWYPRAENVYKLGTEKAKQGNFADPLTLTPHYLRNSLI